jgi:uncharacterized protein YjiS (DUF1127 family)
MFKKLFSTDPAMMRNDASANQSRGLAALRVAYADWRFGNDVAAIVVALNRLPNHRLHMIGLHREGLVDAVGEMILSAEEDRAVGQKVIAILEAPAGSSFDCTDITPPEGYPEQTETAAKKRYK